MNEIIKLQAELVRDRDAREFSLGDTLDLKTSFILAVVVFLAAQTEHLFQENLPPCARYLQYVSVIALVLGGIFAVIELYPREYETEGSPSSYRQWLTDLENYFAGKADADVLIAEKFINGYIERTAQRIEANRAINKRKSSFLFVSFLLTLISFAANLLTLAMRLF